MEPQDLTGTNGVSDSSTDRPVILPRDVVLSRVDRVGGEVTRRKPLDGEEGADQRSSDFVRRRIG